jgi:hypothetical protein
MESVGKIMIGVGLLLVVMGLCFWLFGDRLAWFGHLPGDIVIQRPGFTFYAPITSMIIVSIVLSLVCTLIARFLK